jgi:DNA helicase-2/ATP-dependent DNA helicase PcrA
MRALAEGGAGTRGLVDVLVDELGLAGSVQSLDTTRHGMNRAAQGDDLAAIRQLAALHDDPATFERWLRDGLAVRRDGAGVVLATVHRVKGQEWPYVVVHLADADQFPHRLADDVEEERRLLHVAITRARHHVTIVSGEHPSRFLDELTTEPPARLPSAPDLAPAAVPRRAAAVPSHPLLEKGTVIAVTGLVLVDQGEWAVRAVEADGVVTVRGDATRRFPLGSSVETAGKQRGKLRPPPDGVRPVTAWAYDELRRFRTNVADGKPAYTVFDDKTLVAIAEALPATLDDLARVKGVGPAKLEQYGDAVLEVLTAVLDP